MSGSAGAGRLLALALRRDRTYLPVWIVSLTVVHGLSALSMVALYGSQVEREALARSVATSGVAILFNGLVSGTNLGAVTMSQTLLLMCVGSALMSAFAIVRHTRQDEEAGRTELLVASSVGRRAPLIAALGVVVIANVALAVLNAATLAALGFGLVGSLAAGAAIGGVGLAHGSIALVAAQVGSTARAANGLAGAVLGASFVLRGVGDVAGSVDSSGVRVVSAWPSWLTPLGWGQQVRPYDGDLWLVVGALVVFSIVAAVFAFVLLEHRDLGSGMLAVRPGPPEAGPALRGPLGLAWRLQRVVLLVWLLTMVVVGFAFGYMAADVEDMVGASPGTVDLLEQFGGRGTIEDVYLAATVAMAGIGVAAYSIQAVLRLESEESAGRAETVLALAVSRWRWAGAHLLVVTVGTVLLLVAQGASSGLAHGLDAGDPLGEAATYAWAGLVQVPAALALGGLAVLLYGALPGRSRGLAWGAYAVSIVLGQLGASLRIPDVLRAVSPFEHLPAVPVEAAAVLPVAVLTSIGVVSAWWGLAHLSRRDIDVG